MVRVCGGVTFDQFDEALDEDDKDDGGEYSVSELLFEQSTFLLMSKQ